MANIPDVRLMLETIRTIGIHLNAEEVSDINLILLMAIKRLEAKHDS